MRIKIKEIKKIIKKYDLDTKNRAQIKCYQRYFLYKYLRNNGYTLEEIGKLFNRNHDTVIHGINTFCNLLYSKNKDFVIIVNNFHNELDKKKYNIRDFNIEKVHEEIIEKKEKNLMYFTIIEKEKEIQGLVEHNTKILQALNYKSNEVYHYKSEVGKLKKLLKDCNDKKNN